MRCSGSKSSFIPNLYLQNLSADRLFTWYVTLKATYDETDYWIIHNACTTREGVTNLGNNVVQGPASVSMSGGSEDSTTLTTSAQVIEKGTSDVELQWNNSMMADGQGVISPSMGGSGLSGFVYQASWNDTHTFSSGVAYEAAVNTSSYPGGWNSSWKPSMSAAEQTSSPVQATNSVCQFVYQTNTLSLHGLVGVGGPNDTATVTWWANGFGVGVLEYSEVGTSWSQTVTSVVTTDSNGTDKYTATVHGLPGTAFYSLTATTTVAAGGCLSLSNAISSTAFFGQGFTLTPFAYAYDSITQQGGGEGIYAYLSPQLYTLYTQSTVSSTGGYLDYGPANDAGPNITIPISSLSSITCGGNCFLVNITPTSPNLNYVVQETLNFSWDGGSYSMHSAPTTFNYLWDTSGDGLTDAEKVRGWNVTYQDLAGTYHTRHVTAEPSAFATNGLVGDYVEKEFGLDPGTVDTAGSHMLDTWNLTFNLQPAGGSLPTGSDLRVWYENSTYEPFAAGLQYSHGLYETGNPPASERNATNISATGGVNIGDGSPWASTALFSYPALETFVGLSGVQNAGWLRAVEGSWQGIPTLTVEGKLSWGADPLAASTPNDGVSDGARVNPLYDVGLEFHSVYANLTGLGSGNDGNGYAVEMVEGYTDDGGNWRYINNYSTPAVYGNSSSHHGDVTDYTTTLPVGQTQPTQTISLEVAENITPGQGPQPAYINGSGTGISETYDLVRGGNLVVNVVGWSGHGGYSTLYGVFTEVPMGTKAPTWLWVPTDNSTVNGLPIGLQRYTGEQSFDLVVVNVSSSALSSDPIPLPWGGTTPTGIPLSAGLNDFLVPREQFLYSPFGQAIFLGKSTSFNASQALPFNGSIEWGDISGFGSPNPMVDLGAYWQNRAIASGPGNITGYNETGTAAGTTDAISVMVGPSATTANTGGLPSNPSLYSTVGDPSALQSIVTLNITSPDTLDLLLAALLDNTTGGSNAVNGTLESVTYQIGFLGLNPTVLNAIPNGTEPNDGLYGQPSSTWPPNPPSSLWGSFWNAVTSFVVNPLGTVLSLVNTVWDAATAAFTYLNHLAHEAVAIGAEVVARTAAAIVQAGREIANAFEVFLNWLYTLVKDALAVVIDPILNAAQSFDSTLATRANVTVSDQGSLGYVTPADGLTWARAFDPVAYLGFAFAVGITIVIGIVTAVTLGAGFVVGVILSLIPTLAQELIHGLATVTSLTSSAVTTLEDSFSNSVSQTDWEALAGAVSIGASSFDFFFALATAAMKGLTNTIAGTLALSIIVDLVVFVVSIVNWASHLADIAIAALLLAGAGTYVAFRALGASASIPELKTYATVSVILAGVGLAAAGADVHLAES